MKAESQNLSDQDKPHKLSPPQGSRGRALEMAGATACRPSRESGTLLRLVSGLHTPRACDGRARLETHELCCGGGNN